MKLRPFILYIRSFGIKVFLSKLVRKFFWKSSSRFGRWINQKNETIITEFLMRNIVREMNIPQILGTANTESVGIPRIIWVMWWQGIGQAPDLVKKCVSQIYKYNENCEIRLIDHINYGDYVDISKEILEGIHEGTNIVYSFFRYHSMPNFVTLWGSMGGRYIVGERAAG